MTELHWFSGRRIPRLTIPIVVGAACCKVLVADFLSLASAQESTVQANPATETSGEQGGEKVRAVTIEPGGLAVARVGDSIFGGKLSHTQHTTALFAIKAQDSLQFGITSIDKDKTKIDLFQGADEKNHAAAITLFSNCSPVNGMGALAVSCAHLFGPETKSIRVQGTAVVLVARKLDPMTSQLIVWDKGAAAGEELTVRIGKMELRLELGGRIPPTAEHKNGFTGLSIEADDVHWRKTHRLKFTSDQGEPLEASRSGGGSGFHSVNGQQVEHSSRTYMVEGDLEKLRITIVPWGDVRLVRIPFDLQFGIDLSNEVDSPDEETKPK